MSNWAVSDAQVTRAELAAQRLGMLAQNVAPGARLGTKTELREACEVSVGTFNEALRLAQARGLIVVRPGPGGGLFAAEQSPMVRLGNSVLALDAEATSVADAVRIRDALEPLLIADASWHSSQAEIAQYRAEIAAMAEATTALDADGFLRANWRLHKLFAQVSPSPMLRSIYLALLDMIEEHTLTVLPIREKPLPEVVAERYQVHADLVEAIARHDEPDVARLIAAHSVKPLRAPQDEPMTDQAGRASGPG